MTPQQFIAKWQAVNLTERSACQQHFLDLCELLGHEKPAAADPEGAWYCFERGVSKTEGGQGWADVWMRGHFGWEYKGKHKDLVAAYRQLLLYRESLENLSVADVQLAVTWCACPRRIDATKGIECRASSQPSKEIASANRCSDLGRNGNALAEVWVRR